MRPAPATTSPACSALNSRTPPSGVSRKWSVWVVMSVAVCCLLIWTASFNEGFRQVFKSDQCGHRLLYFFTTRFSSPRASTLKTRTQAVERGPGWMDRVLRGVALFAALGLAIVLTAALAGYSPDDPSSWSSTGSGGAVHNWIGPVGAHAAGDLLSLFGYVAYLLPLAVVLV